MLRPVYTTVKLGETCTTRDVETSALWYYHNTDTKTGFPIVTKTPTKPDSRVYGVVSARGVEGSIASCQISGVIFIENSASHPSLQTLPDVQRVWLQGKPKDMVAHLI